MKHSGKFVLRAGPQLHGKLKQEAMDKGKSLNAYCIERLTMSSEGRYKWLKKIPFSILGVLQYGSSVRGEATRISDLDILLILDRSIEVDRDLYYVIDQLEGIPRQVSLSLSHLPNLEEQISNFWLELAMEAVVIEEEDFKVSRHLISIRKKVASGQYQRYETHGQPYWIFKEDNEKSKVS